MEIFEREGVKVTFLVEKNWVLKILVLLGKTVLILKNRGDRLSASTPTPDNKQIKIAIEERSKLNNSERVCFGMGSEQQKENYNNNNDNHL